MTRKVELDRARNRVVKAYWAADLDHRLVVAEGGLQDCYDETVAQLGFDPLPDQEMAAAR